MALALNSTCTSQGIVSGDCLDGVFGKIKSCLYILRNISENKVTQMNSSKNLVQQSTNGWEELFLCVMV